MRSFLTSSLDNIDPPAPYVNAMNWDAYRSQFRSDRSRKSGNRNCSLASCSLNPELGELSGKPDIPFIIQNTLKGHFIIEIKSDSEPLSALEVDACFGDAGMGFLVEMPLTVSKSLDFGSSITDGSGENRFDLELGILESVQEIAIALARTSPKRTLLATETADPA
ncbi:MAG TPA: hypothetical protein VM260_10740 [Pirellula sp.]|nr:hypothetical protein [Pirellula sp.]